MFTLDVSVCTRHSSVRLSPPPDLDHNPAMIGAREMDISKCYGDITLEFYAPEYKQSDGNLHFPC